MEKRDPVQGNPAIYVSLTLLAALGFAAAAVLQQAEAARQDPSSGGGGSLLRWEIIVCRL